MPEIKIARPTQIDDPALRTFAQSLADGLMAAGYKAAAHHANPKQFLLPAGDTLERAFLTALRSRPLEHQTKLANKAVPIVTNKQVPGFEGIDFASAQPVLQTIASKLVLAKPTAGKGKLTKVTGPVIEEGAPGFRQQAALDQLQFHLLSVKCIDETDGFLASEAGSDEIAFGGVMVDASGATFSIPRYRVGDFGSDGVVRNFDPPVQFGVLDLRSGSGWPKTFTLALSLVELDNGNFPALLQKLLDELRKKITDATTGLVNLGDTIDEIIAGAVAWVLDKVFGWLQSWWEDDVFKAVTMTFEFSSADDRFANGQSETSPLWVEWSGHGGRYRLWFKAKLGLAAEATQASGAIFYEHASFGGKAVTLPVGHYTLAQMQARGLTNDSISSMKIGAGMRVIAYQHDGFAGAARLYTGAVAGLGDFNDQISSIVVEPVRVMLFQHANFGGESQAFGVGRYDVQALRIGNDAASSIMVPPGYRVTLFQHAGFQGAKKVLTADAGYVGNDFNDQCSSLIVEYV